MASPLSSNDFLEKELRVDRVDRSKKIKKAKFGTKQFQIRPNPQNEKSGLKIYFSPQHPKKGHQTILILANGFKKGLIWLIWLNVNSES